MDKHIRHEDNSRLKALNLYDNEEEIAKISSALSVKQEGISLSL